MPREVRPDLCGIGEEEDGPSQRQVRSTRALGGLMTLRPIRSASRGCSRRRGVGRLTRRSSKREDLLLTLAHNRALTSAKLRLES